MPDFFVIAHRGASGLWPENTLLAFHKALEYGATWLELDVHLSADRQLVVIHDQTLDRTTNGHGPVGALSVAELETLDAGNGEKIPRLEEVLELAEGRAAVNIELKGKGTGEALAGLLQQRINMGKRDDSILASSLYEKELRMLSGLLPKVPLALVADRVDQDLWQLAEELDVWSLNLEKGCITQALSEQVKRQGRKLLAFTVNQEQQLQELISRGVDGVFTDFPERFTAK